MTDTESRWLWYALKLVGFFLFAVLMTCYWTFIDQYHHLQDAKRLYSLFSSTIFLGAASTGLLMQSGLLDLEHLMIVIVTLLLFTRYWVGQIAHRMPVVAHEEIEAERDPASEESFLSFFFRSIISSRFTLLLMTSNFLIYLLLVITEYNYLSTFESYFSTDPQSQLGEGTEAGLTLFLGKWLATVSTANLVFGLFLYSRLIRRFGISILLLITPILLTLSFTGWMISSYILFPLLGFFVVEGTLYVIDDNNFNLLLTAVPAKLKYKIRVIIESFFEPLGMLLSSLLLSFFQEQSKLLGLCLALGALFIACLLSANYLKALFFNLSANSINFHKTARAWVRELTGKQRRNAASRLMGLVKMGDRDAQLFACEALLTFEDMTLTKQLLHATPLLSNQTKIALLSLFDRTSMRRDPLLLDCLLGWMQQQPAPILESSILFYLAKRGWLPFRLVSNDLESADLLRRGAAIVSLLQSPVSTDDSHALALSHFNRLIQASEPHQLSLGLSLMAIEGIPCDLNLLLTSLSHPSLAVARMAAHTLSQLNLDDATPHVPHLITLLPQLQDGEVRLHCLQALMHLKSPHLIRDLITASLHFRPGERRLVEEILIQMGPSIVPILLSIVEDATLPNRSRLLAGRVLGNQVPTQLREHLSSILVIEIERASFYLFHHYTLASLHPHWDLHLIEEALLAGYDTVIDFIVQLLGVAGEIEDETLLSRSLKSPHAKIRSQVVEMLERTCEPALFRLLRPLIEDLPSTERIKHALNAGHPPLHLAQLLSKMETSSIPTDRVLSTLILHTHPNLHVTPYSG